MKPSAFAYGYSQLEIILFLTSVTKKPRRDGSQKSEVGSPALAFV